MKRKKHFRTAKVSEEDRLLFRKSIGKIKRMKQDRIPPFRPYPKPLPRIRQPGEYFSWDLLNDNENDGSFGEDSMVFSRPGLQYSTLRKLREGHYPIDSELDLHGLNVSLARLAVSQFLYESLVFGARCVQIIHGKGHGSHEKGPVLKGKVAGWLRQSEDVLAYCPARQTDGGTGALYVLLRRNNPTILA